MSWEGHTPPSVIPAREGIQKVWSVRILGITQIVKAMTQDIAFLCVSNNIVGYLGYKKVKAAFPDISSDFRDFRSRIAYVAHFDDTKIAKLKNALANHHEAKSAIDSFFCNVLVREIGSDPCVENRRKLVFHEFNAFIVHSLYVRLKDAYVQGVDEWLKDIKRYYEYDDQFADFYLEGCYALALQKTGMMVKMRPYGGEGPDLQISTEYLSFDVEISRFRPDISLGNRMNLGEDETPCLVRMPDKSQNVWSKIESKVKQLRKDKNGIILLFSDDIGIDWIDLEKNAEYISEFGKHLCAVMLSDRSSIVKLHLNPCASISTEELTHSLQGMTETLQGLKAYGYFWQNDLQRMCDNHGHQYH